MFPYKRRNEIVLNLEARVHIPKTTHCSGRSSLSWLPWLSLPWRFIRGGYGLALSGCIVAAHYDDPVAGVHHGIGIDRRALVLLAGCGGTWGCRDRTCESVLPADLLDMGVLSDVTGDLRCSGGRTLDLFIRGGFSLCLPIFQFLPVLPLLFPSKTFCHNNR